MLLTIRHLYAPIGIGDRCRIIGSRDIQSGYVRIVSPTGHTWVIHPPPYYEVKVVSNSLSCHVETMVTWSSSFADDIDIGF